MSTLADQYAEIHGGRVNGAAELARDLMRGDEASFKAGYTLENAVIAVDELFCLGRDERERVLERLQP